MTGRTRYIISEGIWHAEALLSLAVVAWMLCTMLGCAAGSSSEITPAKSEASDKTLKVSAPERRTWKVTIRPEHATAFEAVMPLPADEGEDK